MMWKFIKPDPRTVNSLIGSFEVEVGDMVVVSQFLELPSATLPVRGDVTY